LSVERLRSGELIAGASATALLIFLFAPEWYSLKGTLAPTATILGARSSWNGWWGLAGARYLVLVTIAVALALVYFQAAQRAPALPVALSVIVLVLGGACVIALVYRVLAGPPSGGSLLDTQVGPYLGLVAAAGIAYGGFRSLREESGADPAALEIETVRLTAHS
jgi:hypothetical protein